MYCLGSYNSTHLKESNLYEHDSFYQLLKFLHLLVIREGEESQEDRLKIRSVIFFLEAWMLILRSFELFCLFSCESKLRNWLNSQTWKIGRTTNFMCGRWNFNQKLKKWTWLHMMRFSCRIMNTHVSIYFEMYFMRFIWKGVFVI